jgi:hypothetical protein
LFALRDKAIGMFQSNTVRLWLRALDQERIIHCTNRIGDSAKERWSQHDHSRVSLVINAPNADQGKPWRRASCRGRGEEAGPR